LKNKKCPIEKFIQKSKVIKIIKKYEVKNY